MNQIFLVIIMIDRVVAIALWILIGQVEKNGQLAIWVMSGFFFFLPCVFLLK